jgi:hypothetical protein
MSGLPKKRYGADPVVVPDGPLAGGGAGLMRLDSGMPAGPGLLATWVPVSDPKTKNAKARIKAAAIAINVSDAILRPRSLFGIGLSFVLSDCLLLASAIGAAHFDCSFRPIHSADEGERHQAKLAGITNSSSQGLMRQ